MPESLSSGDSQFRLFLKHFSKQIDFFSIQLVELWASKNQITFSIHCNDLLASFSHKKMLSKDYVIEDTTSTENIADW